MKQNIFCSKQAHIQLASLQKDLYSLAKMMNSSTEFEYKFGRHIIFRRPRNTSILTLTYTCII